MNPAEADLKVKTLPEWNAWILSKQEALKSLYSGKGESLAFNTQYRLIAYNKVTQQMALWYNARTRNMKTAVHAMAMRAVDFTFKKEQSKYWAYVMAANEGNPFFCSEGDLDSEICKRIIGNAVSQRWISGPLELLFDRGLDTGHKDYFYYALLRTADGKVERMDLEANHGMAVGRFRALFPTDRSQWKYKAGVMSHTGFPWWTSQRFSAELPRSPYEFHDVYELIAEHVQKNLESFVESGADEKTAGLETQDALVARTDAKLASLKSLYKGANPRLYKPYRFGITVLNKRDNWLGHGYWQANVHLGSFMTAATQAVYNRWIKAGTQQPAFLIYSQSEGVMHCSESDDLSDYYCRVMIGYTVTSQRLWAPDAMTDPLRNNPNGKDRGWAIVTRAKDSDKITKMFTRDAAKFNQMRAQVVSDPTVPTAFSYMPHQNRRVVPFKTDQKGRTGKFDTYELIASFIAEDYGAWKKAPALSEKDLNLVSLKELNLKKNNMRKKLLGLYSGENSNLVKPSHFTLIFYDKRRNKIQAHASRVQRSMRRAINQMANDAVQFYFSRRHFDFEYLLASRQAGPLYCSASDDFKAPDCQRMIGWAVQTSVAYLEPPVNSQKSASPGLLDDRTSGSRFFMALVRDKANRVSRLNFTNAAATSIAQFNALVGPGKQYRSGMVFDSQAPRKAIVAKTSAYEFEETDMDIYEIWAQYLQDVCNTYTAPVTSEAQSSLATIKSRDHLRQAELERVMAPLKGVQSEPLFQPY